MSDRTKAKWCMGISMVLMVFAVSITVASGFSGPEWMLSIKAICLIICIPCWCLTTWFLWGWR